MKPDNLLSAIYGEAAKPEDVLSESFAHLLRQVQRDDPPAVQGMISSMLGHDISSLVDDDDALLINTQVWSEATNGKPDIVISNSSLYVIVECKDQADVDFDQLEKYGVDLDGRAPGHKFLVSLTRVPISVPGPIRYLVEPIRWINIDRWLGDCPAFSDPTTMYLVEQFRELLEEKDLSVQHVGQGLVDGFRDIVSLRGQLREATIALGFSPSDHDAAPYGIYVNFHEKLRIGMRFNSPNILEFGFRGDPKKDVPENVRRWSDVENDHFSKRMDLGAAGMNYFESDTAAQMAILREFISSCLAECGITP